jgi:hypothetical protein
MASVGADVTASYSTSFIGILSSTVRAVAPKAGTGRAEINSARRMFVRGLLPKKYRPVRR